MARVGENIHSKWQKGLCLRFHHRHAVWTEPNSHQCEWNIMSLVWMEHHEFGVNGTSRLWCERDIMSLVWTGHCESGMNGTSWMVVYHCLKGTRDFLQADLATRSGFYAFAHGCVMWISMRDALLFGCYVTCIVTDCCQQKRRCLLFAKKGTSFKQTWDNLYWDDFYPTKTWK